VCVMFDISRVFLQCVVGLDIQEVPKVCCLFDISREFIWCVLGLIYPGSSYGVL